MRSASNLYGLVILAGVSLGLTASRGADAVSTVDYTQRNTPFAPGATVTPDKKKPQIDDSVQDKRVDKTILDRKSATVGDRRAAVDVHETREKVIREKESHRPEVREQPVSAFSHQRARIATDADSKKPAVVAKYQDSLGAASATNMARYPALDRATGATINRFVFRKNGAESATANSAGAITPAAGGSPVLK